MRRALQSQSNLYCAAGGNAHQQPPSVRPSQWLQPPSGAETLPVQPHVHEADSSMGGQRQAYLQLTGGRVSPGEVDAERARAVVVRVSEVKGYGPIPLADREFGPGVRDLGLDHDDLLWHIEADTSKGMQ